MGHYQIGTWRCLAKMGARLQGYVQRGFRQKFFVLYGVYGIHLGMWPAIRTGKSFGNDAAIMYDHTAHHGIWGSGAQPFFAQFNAAKDVFLVYIHTAKIEQ
jgi:beta-galactosidase/beta-glucuronidase